MSGGAPLTLAVIGRQLDAVERLLIVGADAGLQDDD